MKKVIQLIIILGIVAIWILGCSALWTMLIIGESK